jgi:SAM-dependent methyltransferase
MIIISSILENIAMTNQASDTWDKIRQQFDSSPYPRIALDNSPKNNANLLFIHNLVSAYYLRTQKVIDTKDKLILDAGCGTGYKSLVLAEANPGAKIVGVDISTESVALARKRLEYHGFDNAEFHVLSIEELPNLGQQFDYINCDEVLYILPDPIGALQAMKGVLKPDGIIRSNLHSYINRFRVFCAQKAFKMMGLMDGNPEEFEIDIVVETIKSLKDNITVKSTTWQQSYDGENRKELVLMNYLFQEDKGYSIPDLFAFVKAADLEFISMVNWRMWDLRILFKEPDNLPAFLGMSLPEISTEERLQLFELFHPVHRLLDFWCGHPERPQSFLPYSEWTDSDWQGAKVHIHPQLKTDKFKTDLINCIKESKVFPISQYLSQLDQLLVIDSSIAICLLSLLEQPQEINSVVERWKQFRPIDLMTLQPIEPLEAFNTVKKILLDLESLDYVMIELSLGS